MAWILATHPNIADPDRAVTLAEHAARLTKYQNPSVLDTLAATYAAAGQFDRAGATAQNAIDLAAKANNKRLVQEIQNRIQLYKASRPYIESSPETFTD